MSSIKKNCTVTGMEFDVTPAHQEILERIGAKHPLIGEALPMPQVHPLESARRLFAFETLMDLEMHKSALSGTPQIARIPSGFGYKIVSLEEFFSDRVDNTAVGQSFDFNRTFAHQWEEVLKASVLCPLNMAGNENCDFSNGIVNSRKCFLTFASIECNATLYLLGCIRCQDCVDCVNCIDSENCYSSVKLEKCYSCQHSKFLKNCRNIFGSQYLKNCSNCFGCSGLEYAEYCIFNVQYTKEEYEHILEDKRLWYRDHRITALKECEDFCINFPAKEAVNDNVENSTGWYLSNSKNLECCWEVEDSEDCGYVMIGSQARDCWFGFSVRSELSYMSSVSDAFNTLFTFSTHGGEGCMYSYYLYNSCSNCFGCINLKGKSYCILNKQYTKEEYYDLVPRIIAHMKRTGEWGQFLPPSVSPNFYHESSIIDFFEPIPENEVFSRGYKIREQRIGQRGILDNLIIPPQDIRTVEITEVLGKKFTCEETGVLFAIQPLELAFYKNNSIPLPVTAWKKRLRDLNKKKILMPAI